MSQSQKEAAEYAEVLLAYSRGERIEMRSTYDTGWSDLTYPLWNFANCEYRVAPKPLECYVTFRGDKAIQLTEVGICGDNQRIVLMREVTE